MPDPRSAAAATPLHPKPALPGPHRLRAVDRDETAAALPVQALDFLPPGATWHPAPPHSVPVLPGRPPMVGYLVLVPAEHAATLAAATARARRGTPGAPEQGAADGPVRIDGIRRTAAVDGRPLELTYLEFELLAHLVAHPHRVHTRDQLVTTVWGYGHVGNGRTVDVHVARLRRKLGAEHRQRIRTVRRVGYTYTP